MLLAACLKGSLAVKDLLDLGVSVNLADEQGWTPLMLACQVGRDNMAQKLLEFGADIHSCNKRGENAIFIACYNGHVHVARLLLEHGAFPPAPEQLYYSKEQLTYTESMWVLESVRAEIMHEEEWAKAEKAQAELLEELAAEDKKKKKKKKKQKPIKDKTPEKPGAVEAVVTTDATASPDEVVVEEEKAKETTSNIKDVPRADDSQESLKQELGQHTFTLMKNQVEVR